MYLQPRARIQRHAHRMCLWKEMQFLSSLDGLGAPHNGQLAAQDVYAVNDPLYPTHTRLAISRVTPPALATFTHCYDI